MNRKGFTLVELIATIVVLGIVMSIVLVGVNGGFGEAKDKTEDVFVDTIKDAMSMYLNSTQAKGLNFSKACSNKISKSHGDVSVKRAQIYFSDIINSEYKPITQNDLVNPANEKVSCGKENVDKIDVFIYRDDDYVYYYSINKDEFAKEGETSCLLNDENKIKGYDDNNDPIYYSSVITNLPEGFVCE